MNTRGTLRSNKTSLASFEIVTKARGPLSIHRHAAGIATFEDGLEVRWCNSPVHGDVHVRKVETGRRIAYSSPRVKAVRDRFMAEIDRGNADA